MNGKLNLGLVFGAVVALLLIFGIGSFISSNNKAVTFEQNIIAADSQSQNVLGQYAPKLTEALGVAKLQTAAVRDVISGANETRYGKEGSAATIQWINEQNPNLDQSGYRRIIEMVEAGRNDFQLAQQRKIDMIRTYRTELGLFPGNLFYGILGKPSPGFFEKYGEIVISNHAAGAFATHRDDGVKIQ